MWEQVSHPYKTKDRTSCVYFNLFVFNTPKGRTNDNELNGSRHSPDLICSLISLCVQFLKIWRSKKSVAAARYKITVLLLYKTQLSHYTNNYLHKSQKLSSLSKCVGKTEDARVHRVHPSLPTCCCHTGQMAQISSIPGVTWQHPTCMLAPDVSFEHERVHTNTSTSTALIA